MKIPMQMGGVGYEDKSVTITPSSGNTAPVAFNGIGTTIGFELVYNNDLYFATEELTKLYLAQLDDNRATIRKIGAVTQNRTITVRRYYML